MSRTDGADRAVTIVVACLATAMLMLDISVINTALSSIAHGLDTGLSGLQWVVDAYTLPLAATVLTAGAIADRFGRRRLFLLGVAIFTASSALCGAAGGIEVLVGARAIQGLGASMMFATALALISQVTPNPKDRVNALAAYGAAIGASFALGPFIGGSLTGSAFLAGCLRHGPPWPRWGCWSVTRLVQRDPDAMEARHPRHAAIAGQQPIKAPPLRRPRVGLPDDEPQARRIGGQVGEVVCRGRDVRRALPAGAVLVVGDRKGGMPWEVGDRVSRVGVVEDVGGGAAVVLLAAPLVPVVEVPPREQD